MTRAPDILLPYQQAWVSERASFRVCEKGRRIGITWAQAADDVLTAATAGRAGQDVLYIGYNQDMTREYIDTCAEWARHFQVAAGEIGECLYEDEGDDILAFSIRFASGYEIMALSSAPRNLRGKQGRIIIDEAAFHDRLLELIKAALAMKVWGGETVVISTHNGVDNAFNQLVEDIRAGKRPGKVHRYTFDDAIEQGLAERVFLVQGREHEYTPAAAAAWRQDIIDEYGDDAQEELFCVPARSGGAYLSVGLIEQCMVPGEILRLEYEEAFTWQPEHIRQAEVLDWCERLLLPLIKRLPDNQLHAFGQDFGRTADLTVLAPVTIQQDLVRRIHWLVELRNVPFAQQRQIVWFLLERLPRFVKGAFDSLGNGQQLAEETAQRFGQTLIEQVKLSEKMYQDILPPLKGAFQDKTILVPRDSDVRDDLRSFEVINGIPRLPKVRRGVKGKMRHGDAAIGIALGHYASRMDYSPYDYRPATPAAMQKLRGGFDRPIHTTAGFGARRGIW